MTTAQATREVRIGNERAHAATMAALEDERLMADVLGSLAEFRAGYRGKTLTEIRKEYGL